MTCVINPEDFNASTADPLRWRWSGADVGAIVEALGGRRAAITVDRSSGHTLMDVRLVDVCKRGWSHGSPHVLIQGDGLPKAGTWYDLYQCGMIMALEAEEGRPLGGDATKWRALKIFRVQQRAAIEAARAHERGEAAGRRYGAWKAVPLSAAGRYMVRYEPHDNPPADVTAGTRLAIEVQVTDGQAQVRGVVADYASSF